MFHCIVLHMLHNSTFVHFFGPTEGITYCQIACIDSLSSCVLSCFSGYVYFTKPYILNCYNFFLFIEGMEYHPKLEFISADALLHFSAISITNNWCLFWA